jgi:hypothetical protein
MTKKLPVTLVETDALAFARKFIAEFHYSGGPWSGHSPFSDIESRAFIRQTLQQMLWLASSRLQLIALARAGDADADTVLRMAIVEARSRRAELPTELENYNMEVLADGIGHQSPAIAKKKNRLTRHVFIALTVAAVVDRFGLPATGRSLRRRSACSIVADALEEIGLRLGYKAVEKIWNKYKNAMPTVPGWTSALAC